MCFGDVLTKLKIYCLLIEGERVVKCWPSLEDPESFSPTRRRRELISKQGRSFVLMFEAPVHYLTEIIDFAVQANVDWCSALRFMLMLGCDALATLSWH